MCAAAPLCERNVCLDQVRQDGEVKRGCDTTCCDRCICVNEVDVLFREFLRWDGEESIIEFGSALVSPLAANFDRTSEHWCKSINLAIPSTS